VFAGGNVGREKQLEVDGFHSSGSARWGVA
jgi:hypothetical protein